MKKHPDIIQGTEAWHQLRKGKISGTVLKSLMGTPKARLEAKYELIADRLRVGVDLEWEDPRDRGHRLEDEAIAAFEFETGKTTERMGFIESDENASVGYSPDRLITGTDEEDVEVKCPLGKNYVKMWLTNQVPEEYYWQMIQGFVVNPQLKKRYFVGYNPEIPTHPLHIIEVEREKVAEDIETAREAQDKFLAEIEEELSKIITI